MKVAQVIMGAVQQREKVLGRSLAEEVRESQTDILSMKSIENIPVTLEVRVARTVHIMVAIVIMEAALLQQPVYMHEIFQMIVMNLKL